MVTRVKPGHEPKPGQTISLRTLGEYLNLSPATISLVLNNAPGVRSIPQETRDRVIEAAARFDYRPSFYARSLRKRQTFSIGVLVPDLNDHYATQVLSGMEELLVEEGYFYLTASHRRKPDLLEEYPRLLLDRCVEGFILIDTMLEHSLKLPTVAVAGHRNFEGVTNVVLDQRRAAELALRHLVQLGHRNIAFMRGGSHSSDADERWECQMAAAKELNVDVPEALRVAITLLDSKPEMGVGPAIELVNRGVEFTALVCYNDVSAFGAIKALMDRGLRVPHDVSVVGFDDIQSAAFHNPSLTTIRQPLNQMGAVAARILLQRIRGQATFPDIRSHPARARRSRVHLPAPRRKKASQAKIAAVCLRNQLPPSTRPRKAAHSPSCPSALNPRRRAYGITSTSTPDAASASWKISSVAFLKSSAWRSEYP